MKYKVTDTQLAAIADAIRTKTSSSDLLEFPDGFVSKIGAISAEVNKSVRTISVALNIPSLGAYQSVDTGVDRPTPNVGFFGDISRWTVSGTRPSWFDSIEFYVLHDAPSDKWNIYVRNKTNTQITNLFKAISVTFEYFSAQIE